MNVGLWITAVSVRLWKTRWLTLWTADKGLLSFVKSVSGFVLKWRSWWRQFDLKKMDEYSMFNNDVHCRLAKYLLLDVGVTSLEWRYHSCGRQSSTRWGTKKLETGTRPLYLSQRAAILNLPRASQVTRLARSGWRSFVDAWRWVISSLAKAYAKKHPGTRGCFISPGPLLL